MTSFWHPFADMAQVRGRELPIVRGEGYHVWDADGTRYLDATASLWYSMIGHGRPEVADAVADQVRTLEAYSTFQDLHSPVVEELVDMVASLAPVPRSKVFLTSGGSDSIDTAAKMARRFWQLQGEPERTLLVRRAGAYHGMHTAGTSLAGIEGNRDGYGPLLQEVAEVPWDDADAFDELVERLGPSQVAAFFCEPVIGAGGILAPPAGYLERIRKTCSNTGILFIADEVVTGFGRLGDWFASNRWGLEPDALVCAKGITSGYLPLGAVIAAPRLWEPFWAESAGMWRHGYTYSGHATVARAAIVNLEILRREGLLQRGAALEDELQQALAHLVDHALVREVRAGTGAMAAVQLELDGGSDGDELLASVVPACRRAGIMTRLLAGGAIHVSPPLTLDADGVQELVDGLERALDELAARP